MEPRARNKQPKNQKNKITMSFGGHERHPTRNISNPGENDILCGRGGGTNAHPGNIKFRRLVAAHKLRYLAASKAEKPSVARDVTVTATGEACPEDYATLMNKAALIKAKNEMAIHRLGGGGGRGSLEPPPQQQQQQQVHKDGGGVEYSAANNCRNDYKEGNGHGMGGGNEDDLIEAEIQRLLKQRQEELMNSNGKGKKKHQRYQGNDNLPQSSLDFRGVGGRGNGGDGVEPQPYMGEEAVLREYEQLMQKQRELSMIAGKISSLTGGMNFGNLGGGGGGGGIGIFNNNNGNNFNNNMMSQSGMGNCMRGGMNSNNNYNNGNNFGFGMQHNHIPDAASDYMNRLRLLRQGGGGGDNGMFNNMSSSYFGNGNMMSGNGNMMANKMGNNIGGGSNNIQMQMMQQWMRGGEGGNNSNMGQRKGGQDDFPIEEYQASLQQFLSHGGGRGGIGNKNELSTSSLTQNAGSSNSMDYSNLMCMQVPTKNHDHRSNKRNRRGSLESVDDINLPLGRPTLQSIESTIGRPSFQSVDDLGMRSTFKSVDTMDLMSIGNSINEIIDEDLEKMTPEMRDKHARRLSLTMMVGANDRKNVKPMRNERNKAEFNNSSGGSSFFVQTKGCDGPSTMNRSSQLSMNFNLEGVEDDSRLSFLSVMSELTDYQDMLAKANCNL
ncbi:hypothetical protein ACHAXA_008399 [Cyclostephanos tholiformis]|uniref:DUF6824 domain-containing protein n=1 Tax=Cyclostephanos tholiformis TaxID=382380 RepID=A0ABD3RVV3_9STRA